MKHTMKIKIHNIKLFYEVSGQGSPLILLHGNGEDHSIFSAITKKLERSFRVYAVDSRDHGQSEKTGKLSYDAMAEDLAAFIKTLNLEKPDVLGFSDGAITALLTAMKYPGLIHKMILLGVNLKPEDFTAESLAYLHDEYNKTRDPLINMMLTQPQIELDGLKNVTTPALIAAAEHDIFKPEIYTAISQTLPAAELIIMKDHDHDSYISNTDIFSGEVIRFLNRG